MKPARRGVNSPRRRRHLDIITLDRMLVIAGFLGILLILWAVAQKYRGPLSQKIKADSPMDVQQVLSLGGDSRCRA